MADRDRRYLAEGTTALLVAVESLAGTHRAGGIVTSVDPIQRLRMAAIREHVGDIVGSDQLIQTALDA